jgi:hypothetical protein
MTRIQIAVIANEVKQSSKTKMHFWLRLLGSAFAVDAPDFFNFSLPHFKKCVTVIKYGILISFP